MKKTAIALAVSAAVAAPAFADGHDVSVVTSALNALTFTGNLEYAINFTDGDNDEPGLEEGEDTDLDIGVIADLGNGWAGALSFDLEGETLDENSISFAHDAYGTFQIGGDVYNGQTGRLGAIRDEDLELDIKDGFNYTTPDLNGFSAGITLELNDDDTDIDANTSGTQTAEDDERAMGLGVSYSTVAGEGILELGLGYASGNGNEFEEVDTDGFYTDATGLVGIEVANAPTAVSDKSSTIMSVGGRYTMEQIAVGVHHESAKVEDQSSTEYSSNGIAVSYALTDATSFSTDIIINDFGGSTDSTDNTDITVGVSHSIGNIVLSGAYGNTAYKSDTLDSQGEFDLGVTYNFNNSWSTGATYEIKTNSGGEKGTDVNTGEIFFKGVF